MKTSTMDDQIDALFSTVFHESHSHAQTVEYLDRILSTVREAGQSPRQCASHFGFFADEKI